MVKGRTVKDSHHRRELSVILSVSFVDGIIGSMAKTSTRSRITEIGEESRQRILDAAEQLFIERGYEGTTLADVGKLAGISYGSIPWHFKNKQGLLFAVAERAWNLATHPGPLPAGVDGFNIVMNQMEAWDRNALAPIMNMMYQIPLDPEAEWMQTALDMNNDRHQQLADWIELTMNGRSLPAGLTPLSVAHFWTSASRGIFHQAVAFEHDFPNVADPRGVLRHLILSLLGLTDDPSYASDVPTS